MSDKDKTNTEEEISIWDNKGFLFIVILNKKSEFFDVWYFKP